MYKAGDRLPDGRILLSDMHVTPARREAPPAATKPVSTMPTEGKPADVPSWLALTIVLAIVALLARFVF